MIDISGPDRRIEKIEEIKALDMPVFVWGRSVYGKVITQYLKENGVTGEIKFVVDDEYYTPDDCVISLSVYLEKYANNSIMVFGFYNYKIIQKKRMKYAGVIKHLYDFHLTALGYYRLKWDRQDVEGHLEEYRKTYEMLADYDSKRTMELYLRAAINGEFDALFSECYLETSYFNDITDKQHIDILIDCGAYDGDSIHDFVKVFDTYEKIYAFEPDSENRKRLEKRIEDESLKNVEVVPYGAYKENTTLYFSNEGESSSHMSDDGTDIDVTTIDSYVGDSLKGKNILIKMDIEGSEMDALAGAENTIINTHPCLAICVYHKEHDLTDIPHYINSIAGDGVYDYYLGFHGLDLAELVFYAVPKNSDVHTTAWK